MRFHSAAIRGAVVVAEIGHFALILTLTLALAQSIVPLIGTHLGDLKLMRFGSSAAIGQMVFLTVAFAALIACYVMSDFSVLNVAENSNSAMPLIYKVTATWGNHEGSMLLWVSDPGAVRRRRRDLRRQSAGAPQGPRARRAGHARAPAFWPSSSSPPTRSSASIRPCPTARISIRCCRTSGSPCIRRSSISAMSASRWPSPSRSPR